MSKVAVMGAGAVGSYFGGMLARAGCDVTLIARGANLEAMQRQGGLFIDSINFQELVPMRATCDPAGVGGAELVLFTVKTTGTAAAARAISPYLASGALVLSIQNGVDNVEQIQAASGIEAMASVVYIAASLSGPGRMRHGGRGDLVLDNSPEAKRIAATLVPAGIPCKLSDNLQGDLWQKLIINCASNPITAVTQTGFGPAVQNRFTKQLMADAEAEARAVAKAAGVRLPEGALNTVEILEKYDPKGTSSTAQDIAAHRFTEIDSFNGYIARRGEQLGVATPINRALYALVKLVEDTYPEKK